MAAKRQKLHLLLRFQSIKVIECVLILFLSPFSVYKHLFAVDLIPEEKNRLIIFAVARIHRTKLLATLSGLKLEAEITNLHSSVTCRRKMRPSSSEYSATGQVGRTSIVLLEGVAPNQQ